MEKLKLVMREYARMPFRRMRKHECLSGECASTNAFQANVQARMPVGRMLRECLRLLITTQLQLRSRNYEIGITK